MLLVLICISATVFFGWHYLSTERFSDNQKLADFISKQDHVKQVDIKATSTKDGFFAAYYSDGTSEKMIYFDQDSIFSNRYRYSGAGHSSSALNTYNYSESNSWALIIVYGNNTDLKAASYKFGDNGKTYSNQKLGNYVLDIYRIDHTPDAACNVNFYDKSGKKISEANELKK
jgi:hypothetical protein